MRKLRHVVSGIGIMLMASVCLGQDILELRDGRIVRGSFAGGTANTVRFMNDAGYMDVFGRDEVLALTFGSAPVATRAEPAPTQAPAPAPAPERPAVVTIPSGTLLLVTMDSTLSTDRNRQGERFTATISHDVLVGGQVAVPRGTRVFGRISEISGAGRVAGRPEMRLRLRELDMDGTLVEIRTTSFSDSGNSSFAGTARNAGLGAGIGAAFNGGTGAARGAAIGGATSVLSRGDVVTIPAGSVFEFRLTQQAVIKSN